MISFEASLHMPSDAVIGNDIPSLRNLPLALVTQCSSARRTRKFGSEGEGKGRHVYQLASNLKFLSILMTSHGYVGDYRV